MGKIKRDRRRDDCGCEEAEVSPEVKHCAGSLFASQRHKSLCFGRTSLRRDSQSVPRLESGSSPTQPQAQRRGGSRDLVHLDRIPSGISDRLYGDGSTDRSESEGRRDHQQLTRYEVVDHMHRRYNYWGTDLMYLPSSITLI